MFIDSHSFNQFGRRRSLSSSSTLRLINKNQWSDSFRMKPIVEREYKNAIFMLQSGQFFIAIHDHKKGIAFQVFRCDKFIVKLVLFPTMRCFGPAPGSRINFCTCLSSHLIFWHSRYAAVARTSKADENIWPTFKIRE